MCCCCICCCKTRQSYLIAIIVITSILFIFSVNNAVYFGTNTKIYEYFKKCIDFLDSHMDKYDQLTSIYYKTVPSFDYYKIKNILKNKNPKLKRKLQDDIYLLYYDLYYNLYLFYSLNYNSFSEEDKKSISSINSLTFDDLKIHSYKLIKNVKGFEIGVGIILLIFPILFLIIAIIFLIFTCGENEYKVLPSNHFKIFNIIKIICIISSSILILITSIYGIIIHISFWQYTDLVKDSLDSCINGLLLGFYFGYFGIGFYITILILFIYEKKRFFEVGSAENPGPNARYNIAGNLIRDNAQNNNIAPQNRDQVVIGEARTIEVQQNINGNEHHDVFPLGSKTKMKNEDEK